MAAAQPDRSLELNGVRIGSADRPVPGRPWLTRVASPAATPARAELVLPHVAPVGWMGVG